MIIEKHNINGDILKYDLEELHNAIIIKDNKEYHIKYVINKSYIHSFFKKEDDDIYDFDEYSISAYISSCEYIFWNSLLISPELLKIHIENNIVDKENFKLIKLKNNETYILEIKIENQIYIYIFNNVSEEWENIEENQSLVYKILEFCDKEYIDRIELEFRNNNKILTRLFGISCFDLLISNKNYFLYKNQTYNKISYDKAVEYIKLNIEESKNNEIDYYICQL